MTTQNTANSNENSGLTSLIHEAGPRVLNAIKKASAATGVDFSYMLEKASAESGLNAKAKSTTSSATGLYQFIDSTWMSMVKKYGAKCGLGHLAACIDSNGHVANSATRQEILNLRKDPDTAAMMAAEYTAENKTTMQQQLGPNAQIGPTELYLAHFMGAGGATTFMKAYQDNPLQSAAPVCGKAAGANHSVFYDHSGKPRSLAAVYDLFARKFGVDGTPCDSSAATSTATTAEDNGSGDNSSQAANADTTVTAMLMAQSGLDAAALSGGDAAQTADSGTADNMTATNAAMATQAVASSHAAHAANIHWFTPRLSIARIENNSKLNAMQATVSHLQASLSTDPAHMMTLNEHRHAASHLNGGRTRAHDAYSATAS